MKSQQPSTKVGGSRRLDLTLVPLVTCWCLSPTIFQQTQRLREPVAGVPRDQPPWVESTEQGRVAQERPMENTQPRVTSQRPRILGLQPTAAFRGQAFPGQFQGSAYCWERTFEQSLSSPFQQQGWNLKSFIFKTCCF